MTNKSIMIPFSRVQDPNTETAPPGGVYAVTDTTQGVSMTLTVIHWVADLFLTLAINELS